VTRRLDTPFDLSETLVGLHRDGVARPLSWHAGPPPRVDVWHRVVPKEPSQLVYITPGPRGERRPLAKSA
jgi:hypothetical protein